MIADFLSQVCCPFKIDSISKFILNSLLLMCIGIGHASFSTICVPDIYLNAFHIVTCFEFFPNIIPNFTFHCFSFSFSLCLLALSTVSGFYHPSNRFYPNYAPMDGVVYFLPWKLNTKRMSFSQCVNFRIEHVQAFLKISKGFFGQLECSFDNNIEFFPQIPETNLIH